MKVCVFGAGAIGGHVAARLARGGADVSVVARGAMLAALRDGPLRVTAPDGAIEVPVAATDDPATLGPQDAVIVTVKAPSLPAVAATIGPLLGPETPVAFVMNGIPWWYFHAHPGPHQGRRLSRVDPDDALWNAIGPERAIGGVVYSACTVTEPGHVFVETRGNRVILGEPDGALSGRAEDIARALRAGGMGGELTDNIRGAVWEKLLFNIALSLPCALAQSGQSAMAADPACALGVRTLLREAASIAAAYGRPVAHDPDAVLGGAVRLNHKPSIVQDLELGRPPEIDALFTTPLELADLAGVAAPTFGLLTALLRLRTTQAERCG